MTHMISSRIGYVTHYVSTTLVFWLFDMIHVRLRNGKQQIFGVVY